MIVLEILKFLGDTGLVIALYIVQGLFIFITGLGAVYIFGRMLEVEKKDRQKNITALIIMMITTSLVIAFKYGIDYKNWEIEKILYIILEFIGFISFSTITYVLIGWRLYERVDTFLDKKIGDDKDNTSVKKSRVSKIKLSNIKKTKFNKE